MYHCIVDELRKWLATKLHTNHASYINTLIEDANSAFSPDQSVLNLCSAVIAYTVTVQQTYVPPYAATLHRPVYASSFWTPKDAQETSRDPSDARIFVTPSDERRPRRIGDMKTILEASSCIDINKVITPSTSTTPIDIINFSRGMSIPSADSRIVHANGVN